MLKLPLNIKAIIYLLALAFYFMSFRFAMLAEWSICFSDRRRLVLYAIRFQQFPPPFSLLYFIPFRLAESQLQHTGAVMYIIPLIICEQQSANPAS